MPSNRAIDLVVVGDAGVDLFVDVPRLAAPGETVVGRFSRALTGGMAANTARAAARLGLSSRLVATVGDDAFGTTVLAALEKDGVDATYVRRLAGVPTFLSVVQIAHTGEQTLVVAQTEATYPSPETLTEDMFVGVRMVHVTAGAPELALRAVEIARRLGARISVDLDAIPQDPEALIAQADLITVNEQGARHLFPDLAPAEVASRLHQVRGAQAVVTLGADGAWGASRDGVTQVAAARVAAVDTTGAGDAFAAALAMGQLHGTPFDLTLQAAVNAAAEVVTRVGG